MDFLTLAAKRCSVREFDSRPVEKEKLDKVLEAARLAPTAVNYQPFKVYVLQSDGALAKAKECSPYIFDAPAVIMVAGDSETCYKRRHDGKPSFDIDASIVATHIILEAADLGLGTTWVMVFDNEKAKRLFGLPAGHEICCFIPIGYPKEGYRPSERHSASKPIADLVEYR